MAATWQNGDRPSSRVMRPPGGAHSDIFGIYDNNDAKHHIKYNQPKSQISEVFGSFDDVDNKKPKNKEENDKDQETEKEVNDKNENGINENEISKSIPQRTRVPPGGFSSGLW